MHVTQNSAARAHARAIGHRNGALYPWRTIGGDECSSHYPTGSAQYHINGDIAYALALAVAAQRLRQLRAVVTVGGGGCSCRWSGLSIPRISRVSDLRPLNTARLRMCCLCMHQCLHSEVYTCREDAHSLLHTPVLTPYRQRA